MAYINIAEWTPKHVGDWLKGLDDSILPYVHFFLNNDIDGQHLLILTPDDLTNLHITKVGHQELILEAINLLRLLHYNLTSENLQCLALKLACKARSLYNELRRNGPIEDNGKQERVSTLILSSVSDILLAVKSFISWLDRYPFEGKEQYNPIRKTILKLSIELASTAQRDQFVEKPHTLIKNSCLNLANLCDKVVQEFSDSLIIQPASLDVATVKKKPEEELGIHLHSSYSGVHIVGGVKFQSPADRCGKVDIGDEIVQVNYQTVVGWQLKKLVYAMREHPTEVYLTLKKRPRHTNILGQVIVLRPYRIPSKKSAFGKVHKWSEGNSSLHIQEYSSNLEESNTQDVPDDDDDSAFLPDYVTPNDETSISAVRYHIFPGRSRATVQRRATVSGASPTVKRPPVSIEELVLPVGSKSCKKEVIGRSISHDPSKHKISESSLKSQKLEVIKSDGSEDYCDKVPNGENVHNEKDFDKNENENLISKSSSVTSVSSTLSDGLKVSNIIIPLHEEEYTILENKSLRKLGTVDKISVKEDNSEKKSQKTEKLELSNELQSTEGKKNLLTGPWEGHDTVFHGRRPSIQEVENEIASSSTVDQPVLTKEEKVDDGGEAANVNGMKSYQVVIIGGVPQKCHSPGRDIKKLQSPPLKKRSHVTGKFSNRRISCKDLGKGDCQGWLYKRKMHKSFLTGARWTKRWVVLKNHNLFSYHNKDDPRAESLIYLPGFTVSPATECKSKKYSFKLHHPGTTFYFATDSQEDMTKWMNKMGLAAISYDATLDETTSGFTKVERIGGIENAYYSETEDESEDSSPLGSTYLCSHEISPCSTLSGNSKANYYYEYLQDDSVHQSMMSLHNYSVIDGQQPKHRHSKQTRGSINKQTKYSNICLSKCEGLQTEKDDELKYIQTFRSGYMRSLSCTDASSHYIQRLHSSEKHAQHPSSTFQFPRKMSYQEVSSGTSFGNEEKYINSKAHRLSGQWSNLEDKLQDFSTGSLGRQRVMVKEITPGLVARMTGSYNNLSQNQIQTATAERKKSKEHSAPIPGYVAKLSGSFDQLAKCGQKFPKNSLEKNKEIIPEKIKENNIKNSSSDQNSSNEETKSEKFVSMLDKEYHRLYGKKKPSTISVQPGLNNDKQPRKLVKEQNGSSSSSGSVNTNNNKSVKSSIPIYNRSFSKPLNEHNLDNTNKQKITNLVYDKDPIPHLSPNESSQSIPLNLYTKNKSGPEYFQFDQIPSSHNSKFSSDKLSSPQIAEVSANNGLRRTSKESLSEVGDHPSSKSSFKFFGSPKFMKKFTSPKPQKKHNFKNKFTKSEERFGSPLSERKFLGSPKLARAIFGSPKCEQKTVTMSSAAVQTEKTFNSSCQTDNPPKPLRTQKNDESHQEIADECLKTSSNSSLNSSASGSAISSTGSSHYYVETRIRPQITISLPLVTESNNDDRPPTPETPRTPKPTMGIAMIGKRRTPSISNEGIRTGKSNEQIKDDITQYERNEITFDINKDQESDDEMVQLLNNLKRAELTVDGVNVRTRRCRTLLREERGISQMMRSYFALQRTLKDRENELNAIDTLLEGNISSEELEHWASKYPHYMPPEYC
ncbi:uncharacterized protein [Centruroides vittatus]|uniref:uncharacterized protein isoform X2 n=1 Tax=Centruroides vittatus TaxID=120091 RepID=UPI00350FD493